MKRMSRSYGHPGFTLMEALVALIIFGIITSAVSLSLSAAMNAHRISTERQEETGSVRALFGALTRDIQAAIASPNDPNSVFMAGTGQNSTNSTNASSS